MSATVDANVLVYAVNEDAPEHEGALALVERLAAGPDLVYLFWPTVMGFLRISTHPGILPAPLTPADAMSAIDGLLALPHVRSAAEEPAFWERYQELGELARGNLVPDAHLAALMRQHGVRVIYTRDRGFRRFDGIEVIDPVG